MFAKLRSLLAPAERRRAKLVFLLMAGRALLEMVGVASVMPFVAVLADPDLVTTNRYLATAYAVLGFDSPRSFLFFLGFVVLMLFVSSLAFRALTTYEIVRFSNMRLHSIGCRLLAAYLRQPYEFFLNRNTADLGKTLLAEVKTVTDSVLVTALRGLSSGLVALMLLILLLSVEPLLSLAVFGLLGSAYGLIYAFTRRLLRRIGKERLGANKKRYVLANEALNGIKELRILGREETYLQRFSEPSRLFARHQATSRVIGEMPFYVVQTAAFGGILVLVLFLLGRHGGIQGALPLISLYAFAGYRLLPVFQEVFRSATEIGFSLPALDALYADLMHKEGGVAASSSSDVAPLPLTNGIRFESVTYRFPNAPGPAVEGLDLFIPAGSSVALVGRTGAGKSTTTDLLLGLLQPSEGRILIDGEPLGGESLRRWQRNVGYVPQAIFLSDDTVTANIAFGVPEREIDRIAVERAARTARIHDFIVGDLGQGYDTVIGERGVRLSGGQRQRLAIARALYRDADVIVFDEATSALDNATEAAVMQAIEELHGRKTIILIAHRLSTVRKCDRLFLLRGGRLVAQGTPDDLRTGSPEFALLTQVGEDGLPRIADVRKRRRLSG